MKKTIYVLIFTLLVIGCEKEKLIDVLPQLKIIVEDENKSKISNANVTLYKSLDDWSKGENVITFRKTNTSGTVLFKDLEEKKYFFYVEKDKKNNRYGIATTQKEIEKNKITVVTLTIKPFKK